MRYYLAPCLVVLRSEVNGLWANRDKGSDGWVGDTSHAARKSDHNPDYGDGGVVRALDLDEDGVLMAHIIDALTHDDRVAYLIYEHEIWTPGSGWRRYYGVSPHTQHLHVSIKHGKGYENDTRSWGIRERVYPPTSTRAPAPGRTPQKDVPMLLVYNTSTGFAAFVYPNAAWALISDADSALSLAAASGVGVARVNAQTWSRMCPDRTRVHEL